VVHDRAAMQKDDVIGLSLQGVLFNDMTYRIGRLKEEFTGGPIGRLDYHN